VPRVARPQGMPRRHRFSERGSFGPVLQSRRKYRGRVCTLHVAQRARAPARFGLALTRKLVPRASDRNRIKRVAREAFRRHAAKLGPWDCVLSLRQRYDAKDEPVLLEELRSGLDRLTTAPETAAES
jgi:ribonuclease P protein component